MPRVVIAVDVDGTLYDHAGVADEAVRALRQARADGHTIVIVTGRRWEEVGTVVGDVLALADRAICEEGGVHVHVATGHLTLLAEPVEPELLLGLEAANVPLLDVGHVVIGAPTTALALVTEVRDRIGSSRIIITNKGSIALTPPGCDKGSGLRAALADLDMLGRPVLAIGDAENDLPMFRAATIGVGVANSDDAVRASGVPLTGGRAGFGVAQALGRYLPQLSR